MRLNYIVKSVMIVAEVMIIIAITSNWVNIHELNITKFGIDHAMTIKWGAGFLIALACAIRLTELIGWFHSLFTKG